MAFPILPILLGAWFIYDILDIGSFLMTGDGILETVLGNGTEIQILIEYIPGMSWVDFLGGHALLLTIIAGIFVAGLYVLMKPKKQKRRTAR